uniref:Uncharacterized protein n=1 Tax=Ditylenchus dipsaci TaxID=166011 RepID=A0A915E1T7_9BILA
MSNYNYYRDREDNPQKSMLPVAKFEARTPVSNRNEFPRASIPANSTTARSNRMAEPSRNSVASGFAAEPAWHLGQVWLCETVWPLGPCLAV